MKKLLCAILCIAMLMAGGCQSGEKSASQDSVSITDHAGNTVSVPKKISRIAVCDIYPLPSVLAVFFDSAEKIVGMPAPSMSAAKSGVLGELYPAILDAETEYIDGTNVNTEELLSLSPDIVFYSADTPAEGEKLRGAGFCAVAVSASKWNYDAVETLNNWISLLSEIFPQSDKADKVKSYSGEICELVKSRVSALSESEREKAFFLFRYDGSTITTSGKRFFGQWWADTVGAYNVGEELDTENSAAVNMEQIYKWNPSVIFITNFTTAQPDEICSDSVWSGIDAVKNGRVYKMPLGIYRSYTAGADTPLTLLWLAKAVYPQLFEDIDMSARTKDYYKELFGIELTDEQAQRIFAPPSDASAY